MEYPKIETLYVRDANTFRVTDELRLPEFGLINRWLVTEKIDGTNIRIFFEAGVGIAFGGRTDAAQMPTFLLSHLQETFTTERIATAFEPGTSGILFGEGYGAKIQKRGGNYRPSAGFRLIDVYVKGDERGWWLNWDSVEDIACKLDIGTVPVLMRSGTLQEAVSILRMHSQVAATEAQNEIEQEGIVARTDPLLFIRDGRRLMWKLKVKDYEGGKR